MNSWLRRRAPRLSGTLHIRDADGHELTTPLHGRDILLTTPGTGLSGYGAAWAVDTGGDSGVMIVYGATESVDDRRCGICPPDRTITLGGVEFTWLTGAGIRIPAPRSPAPNASPGLRPSRPRTTNARAETGSANRLGGRFRNMVRFVTRARVRR